MWLTICCGPGSAVRTKAGASDRKRCRMALRFMSSVRQTILSAPRGGGAHCDSTAPWQPPAYSREDGELLGHDPGHVLDGLLLLAHLCCIVGASRCNRSRQRVGVEGMMFISSQVSWPTDLRYAAR